MKRIRKCENNGFDQTVKNSKDGRKEPWLRPRHKKNKKSMTTASKPQP
jgi:hypothetical protein